MTVMAGTCATAGAAPTSDRKNRNRRAPGARAPRATIGRTILASRGNRAALPFGRSGPACYRHGGHAQSLAVMCDLLRRPYPALSERPAQRAFLRAHRYGAVPRQGAAIEIVDGLSVDIAHHAGLVRSELRQSAIAVESKLADGPGGEPVEVLDAQPLRALIVTLQEHDRAAARVEGRVVEERLTVAEFAISEIDRVADLRAFVRPERVPFQRSDLR